MRRVLLAGGVVFLIALNAGPILDAVSSRETLARARVLLPVDWRSISGDSPEDQAAALAAAMTPAQRQRAEDWGAVFRTARGGVVLAIPRGLDTDELELASGCLAFQRREVDLIVWHLMIPISCL